jgi:CRISPR-associated protein Cmr5
MNNRKTLTQEYALYAFECIKEIPENLKGKYLSRVKKLPAMITHNGLLTSLAFLYSKAKFENNTASNESALVLKQLVNWLTGRQKKTSEITKEDISKFIHTLAETNFQQLMLYSRRALTLSQWLKRLAEGEFGDAAKEE